MPTWRSCGGSDSPAWLTTLPPRVMLPAVADSNPATARSKVVLPQPEGPISTPMSPVRSPKEMSRTTGVGVLA